MLRWLYQKRLRTCEGMTDLSREDRERLAAVADIGRLALTRTMQALDGTRKYLWELSDSLLMESVLIPDEERLTLCLSTQVGCTLDCRFCLTARMGLKRNLKAHEIVDQVLSVQDTLPEGTELTNLVLMGMGEPLACLDPVTEALRRLTNTEWGVGFSPRRITVSTAGVAPRLGAVAALGVNLAVSLNASTDAERDALMPAVNRLYPLRTLVQACRELRLAPRQRLTFEYVLLAGVNDSPEDARRVADLLRGISCRVNLIPFNDFAGSGFRRPTDATVLAFQAVLVGFGYDTFIRKSKGREILGACGQLGDLARVSPPSRLTPLGAGC